MADPSPSPSTSTSSPSLPPPPPPSAGWLRSIDAVYDLFEQPSLVAQYPTLSHRVQTAVELCEEVINEVGWSHCALSFNGGKDCTVLVHILAAVLRRLHGLSAPPPQRGGDTTDVANSTTTTSSSTPPQQQPSTSSSSSYSPTHPLPPIASLYIACPSPFPTLEKFIATSASPTYGYNLDLVTVQGGMKEGLRRYLDAQRQGNPPRDVRAVFIGTRRDDPHGPSLSPRSWTDADWPRVERIHPILSWNYSDVWDFLRCRHLANPDATTPKMPTSTSTEAKGKEEREGEEVRGLDRSRLADEFGVAGGGEEGVPYCLLYEQGYTSLGSTYNTHPNPILRLDDSDVASLPPPPAPTSAATPASATQQQQQQHPTPSAVVVGDGNASGRWMPAYMLKDGSLERAGREGGGARSLKGSGDS